MPTIDERIMEQFYERLVTAEGVSPELAEQLAAQLKPGKLAKADDLAKLIVSHSGDSIS